MVNKEFLTYFTQKNINNKFFLDSIYRYAYTIEIMKKYGILNRGMKICEIGASPISLFLKEIYKCDLIVFNNTCNPFCDMLHLYGIKINYIDLNINKLPREICFDTILFLEVIEHLQTPPITVLSNLYDSLNLNGFLILSTPNIVRMSNRLNLLLGKGLYKTYYLEEEDNPCHVREYTLHEMEYYLINSGFRIINKSFVNIFQDGIFSSFLNIATKIIPSLSNYLFFICKKTN